MRDFWIMSSDNGAETAGGSWSSGASPEPDALRREAVKWFRKAALQGDAESQCELGFMYRTCLGVPMDWTESFSWYRKAALQGNFVAMRNLSVMYRDGLGTEKDPALAEEWDLRAAWETEDHDDGSGDDGECDGDDGYEEYDEGCDGREDAGEPSGSNHQSRGHQP